MRFTDDIEAYINGETKTLADTEDWADLDSYTLAFFELLLPENTVVLGC